MHKLVDCSEEIRQNGFLYKKKIYFLSIVDTLYIYDKKDPSYKFEDEKLRISLLVLYEGGFKL